MDILKKSKNNKLIIIISLCIIAKLILFDFSVYDRICKKPIALDIFMLLLISEIISIIIKRNDYTILFILNIVFSILLLSNALFYKVYNDFITFSLIKAASQLEEVHSSISSLINFKDLFYIIDIPFVYLLIRANDSHEINTNIIKKFKKACLFFITFTLIFVFIDIKNPFAISQGYSRESLTSNFGLISTYFIDGFKTLKNNLSNKNLSKDDINIINSALSTEKPNSKNFKGKNLIIIQVESLQGFVINKSYNGKEITPNLNKLIKESAYFDNCYYQVGLGHTSDAELLSNTSLYPLKDDVAYMSDFNDDYNSIGTELKNIGYNTMYFHGNKGSFWDRNLIYKNMGFNQFYSLEKFKKDDLIGMGLSDMSFLKQSSDILKNTKEPFYSFLVTLTSHGPFDLSSHNFCKEDTSVHKYYNAINYTDESIGLFIDKLRSSGILDNSILVIYGDHNALNKDELTTAFNKDFSQDYLYQSYQKIPLIVRLPNGENSGVYHKSVGQNDVSPTVLSLLNIKNFENFGNDLFEKQDNFVVLRDESYILGNQYYDHNKNITYDLTTGKQLQNNNYYILKAKNHLLASDRILQSDYFRKTGNSTSSLAKK